MEFVLKQYCFMRFIFSSMYASHDQYPQKNVLSPSKSISPVQACAKLRNQTLPRKHKKPDRKIERASPPSVGNKARSRSSIGPFVAKGRHRKERWRIFGGSRVRRGHFCSPEPRCVTIALSGLSASPGCAAYCRSD